ncbi:hypothetical protein [Bradyrhizobium sp. BRP23]|uniref:hypothetical protein n=1 Tax=Bradyrhizobium sp. BRP23 TaxID=2793820 RepID=UPI001CD5089A|nr:hypothetical protein [Bradyrhizobium sp. BRP23]MCA1381273.1 hypothetical protein [Bradyrhizobium sp. BRP05]MCA1418607.1 hypothetical protein [Bradyrhizobium sp. BRP23]
MFESEWDVSDDCLSTNRKFPTIRRRMEQELSRNLTAVAEAFRFVRPLTLPTLGRLAAGDWRFFDHLQDGSKTFTARKYDQVMDWFSENWPGGAIWPEGIARPERVTS